jgi:serine/threonine protein kinase
VLFADRYEVIRRVGQGGFGSVFEARDSKLGRVVAVKVAEDRIDDSLDGEMIRELFRREAQAAATLRHPSIVVVHDLYEEGSVRFADGSEGKFPLIVMEFVAGPSLAELAGRAPLDVGRSVGIVAEVLGALGAAHEVGVLHRDVKPANVIIPPTGPAKLTDFGIARITGRTTVDIGGGVLASLLYASPEQLLGEATLDSRADLYSASAVLYELLTGRPPFTGDANRVLAGVLHQTPAPPAQLNPSVPQALSDEVLKALAKNPGQRHQTAARMADAIVQAAALRETGAAGPATVPTSTAPTVITPTAATALSALPRPTEVGDGPRTAETQPFDEAVPTSPYAQVLGPAPTPPPDAVPRQPAPPAPSPAPPPPDAPASGPRPGGGTSRALAICGVIVLCVLVVVLAFRLDRATWDSDGAGSGPTESLLAERSTAAEVTPQATTAADANAPVTVQAGACLSVYGLPLDFSDLRPGDWQSAAVDCAAAEARTRVRAVYPRGEGAPDEPCGTGDDLCLSFYTGNGTLVVAEALPQVGDCFPGFAVRDASDPSGFGTSYGWPGNLYNCGAPPARWPELFTSPNADNAEAYGLRVDSLAPVQNKITRILVDTDKSCDGRSHDVTLDGATFSLCVEMSDRTVS